MTTKTHEPHQVSLLLRNTLVLELLTTTQVLASLVIGFAEVVIWDSQLRVQLRHFHRTRIFHTPHAGLGVHYHH